MDLAPHLAMTAPNNVALVEFGSGSSVKTELLLEALGEKVKVYVAFEISQTALDDALFRIKQRFPKLKTIGICEDFTRGLVLPAFVKQYTMLGFFPGSTIGNMEREESIALLFAMRETLGAHATLMVGTDLVKSLDVLMPAYDDALGVSAEFSRNILRNANCVAGTDFCVDAFQHCALWNAREHRIEIYLICKCEQAVHVLGHTFLLHRNERIHIESSHKYTITEFHDLAAHSGWIVQQSWTDQRNWFAVHELMANKLA